MKYTLFILLVTVLLYTPTQELWVVNQLMEYEIIKPVEVKSTDLYKVFTKVKGKYTRKELIDYLARGKLLQRAKDLSDTTGIPLSIVIAQDILESDMGNSVLTLMTKNSGNIKCKCNRSKELRRQHAKDKSCMRMYDKIEKSNDYYVIYAYEYLAWKKKAEVLLRFKIIRNSKGLDLTWKDWAVILHKSPYATDKYYDKKLTNLVNAYQLWKLDELDGVKITSPNGVYEIANL